MQSFIHVTDEATDFFQSVQNHKRFRLRAAAIIAASCGSVLNFFLFFACIVGNRWGLTPPRILTGCAYIPLVLSLAWDHLDLTSRRTLKLDIPPALIAAVDGLGFLGYLTIIIANAIICGNLEYGGGIVVLLVYNSVFWIVCCAVHGIIFLQEVLRTSGMVLYSYGSGNSACAHCRQHSGRGGKPNDGTTYSLLAGQNHHDHDVESGLNREEAAGEV